MFGRLIRLAVPNWSGPLTALEARAVSEPARQRARLFAVEGITPGSPEWLFNCADPGCPECGGMGRISVTVDGVRCWTQCDCVDPSRAS